MFKLFDLYEDIMFMKNFSIVYKVLIGGFTISLLYIFVVFYSLCLIDTENLSID